MTGHRVQRHGKRVGQHRDLVAHSVGDGDQHRLVRREVLGEAAGRILRRPGVDAGRDGSLGEVPAHAVVAGLARPAGRIDAPRAAGEPRVEDDPLADLEGGHGRTHLDHIGDHLVTEDGGKREVAVQRAVAVVIAEVHEDHLGVGATNPGEASLGHGPVVTYERRAFELTEHHRRAGEPDEKLVRVVGRRPALGSHTVKKSLHRPPLC